MLVICVFDCVIILSTLFNSIDMMICSLKRPLVIMFIFGLPFWLDLLMTLWILETLLRQSLGKTFLILNIFLMLLLDIWIYNCLLFCKFELTSVFFLKNSNFTKILLLGLVGIGGGTLKMSAYLSLSLFGLDEVFLLEDVLLNWTDTYYLKDMFFLLAMSLSQPDS